MQVRCAKKSQPRPRCTIYYKQVMSHFRLISFTWSSVVYCHGWRVNMYKHAIYYISLLNSRYCFACEYVMLSSMLLLCLSYRPFCVCELDTSASPANHTLVIYQVEISKFVEHAHSSLSYNASVNTTYVLHVMVYFHTM